MTECSKPQNDSTSPNNPENRRRKIENDSQSAEPSAANPTTQTAESTERPTELGGQKGPEPTRYGDWEKNGRCTDF